MSERVEWYEIEGNLECEMEAYWRGLDFHLYRDGDCLCVSICCNGILIWAIEYRGAMEQVFERAKAAAEAVARIEVEG